MQNISSFQFADVVVHRLVVGPIQENTYVISQDKAAVIIDPGEEAAKIIDYLNQHNLEPEAILLTHAHFDHVGACEELRERLELPICLHKEAWSQLAKASESAARFNLTVRQPQAPDHALAAGELKLELSGITFKALFTPGHAPGHLAFYHNNGFVIAGDALFKGSIGRTDLPGSNHELLIETITKELLTLPNQTIVFPGHGPETSIGEEAEHNPFLT